MVKEQKQQCSTANIVEVVHVLRHRSSVYAYFILSALLLGPTLFPPIPVTTLT